MCIPVFRCCLDTSCKYCTRTAYNQTCQNRKPHPFQKISLPSAVIKFRQGIGRLIRSARDKGLIVVLDSRIISKPYGRSFIDGIPTNRVERFNSKNIDSIIVPELEELGILNLES